jgi:hypothetical protein
MMQFCRQAGNHRGSALTAKPLGDDVLRLMGRHGRNMSMTREELAALRDATDTVLTWPMATCRRRGAPYDAAVELTVTPEPESLDPRPAAAPAPWLKPLGSYDRRETTLVEGTRYG